MGSVCVPWCSCCGPLLRAEGVEGLGEMTMDQRRQLGSQHALAMGFQQSLGCARGGGGGIEAPAEMLAGMAAANRDAVMRQHLVIERRDECLLNGKRRLLAVVAAGEIAGDLSGQPRPPLRGASDHDRVGTGGSKRGNRIR